jgi:hypothetical protein
MRNVTITLKDKVAEWTRVYAARRRTSVSQLVGELLERLMRQEQGYDAAMRSFLSRPPVRLKEGGPYPSRDELHDRSLLR